ncbi:MAG TPA: Crp/Fnr family transcriptional regulator [Pyrinomonadaceae bacterium]|nr:Crp/Fnr family transcriptional regulator [Pyrinomonadaceae bacterium]
MMPSFPASHPTENQILATLDKTEYQYLFSELEPVSLIRGDVIYHADTPIDYVYFPGTAVFSILATMEDGRTVEVGPVGREGVVGLRVFLGSDTMSDRVLVHVAGTAMRLKASVLKAELKSSQTALPQKLIRYTLMLLTMTGRTGACNKLHSLQQQLARWLLTMNDYVHGDLPLTHELIALTLGVRRAGVTETASALKSGGLINYQRGDIRIVDEQALEAVACECYRFIKEEYQQLYTDLAR